MNVNEIRDRILEISHDEIAPDTNLKNKALSWLNSAYQEIVGVCMPYLERYIETVSTITVESGVGILPTNVYRILTIVDSNTGKEIKAKSHADIIKMDTNLSANGQAQYYWVEDNTIHTYPQNNENLKIVYLKQVDDLLDGGSENEILIPKQFHHGLVWGGLVWSSIFERGFSSQSDLKLFQAKWDEAKREVKLSLSSEPSKQLKVKPFDVV